MIRLSSKGIALIGVFSALHAVLYMMSTGLWRNWAIYLEPIEGIILGPYLGFFAALIGSIAARAIKPTDLWIFGIVAEPMGVLACGLLAKKHWKPVLMIYTVMVAAYFLHPFGRWLPLWTILDILLAFVLVYPVARLCGRISEGSVKRLAISTPLISFIGTVTDSLTRVFLLIPAQLYLVFDWPPEVVYSIFIFGAIDSYIEDLLVILVSSLAGAPILSALRKIPGLAYPLS